MPKWQHALQVASAGVAAAAVVELFRNGAAEDAEWRFRRWLLAGGAALVYAEIVPRSLWGVRSGVAFAHLPWLAPLRRGLGASRSLDAAVWGAVAGGLLRALR